MFEELNERRKAVERNIAKGFGMEDADLDFEKALEDELEKGRHGTYSDTAQNRRLNRVGQEYGHKAEEQEPSQPHQKKTDCAKTIDDHAKETDTEVLKKVVADEKAKLELKEAAQRELESRGEGGDKEEVSFDVNLEVAEEMWDEDESKQYDEALQNDDKEKQKKLLNVAIKRAKEKGREEDIKSKESNEQEDSDVEIASERSNIALESLDDFIGEDKGKKFDLAIVRLQLVGIQKNLQNGEFDRVSKRVKIALEELKTYTNENEGSEYDLAVVRNQLNGIQKILTKKTK